MKVPYYFNEVEANIMPEPHVTNEYLQDPSAKHSGTGNAFSTLITSQHTSITTSPRTSKPKYWNEKCLHKIHSYNMAAGLGSTSIS